jgi:hypothetical protein
VLIAFLPGFPHTDPIVANAWYHLFCSFDLTGTDSFVWGTGEQQVFGVNKKYEVYLNRVDVLHGLGDATSAPGYATHIQNTVGCVVPYTEPLPPNGTPGTAPGMQIAFHGMEFTIPTISAFDLIDDAPPIEFANTQLWVGTYVAPTEENLDKFVVLDEDGKPQMPRDVRAAQDAFGASDIWLLRDNIAGIEFGDNQGIGGTFELVGTKPTDVEGPEVADE